MSCKDKSYDRINVKDINCYTKIGVGDREREIGQRLKVDMSVFFDLLPAGKSDDLNDTVSYIELAQTVIESSQQKPYKLLEHFAEIICQNIFAKFEKIKSIELTIYKPHIPNPNFVGQSSIYVCRNR